MKKFTKAIALCLALLLCLSFPTSVSAASVADATIDFNQKGSLTIYKIDLTNAEKDGIWDSSYVSTGVYDKNVYDTLIGGTRAGDTDKNSDLGNGEKSFGYAIKGVEFSYLRGDYAGSDCSGELIYVQRSERIYGWIQPVV